MMKMATDKALRDIATQAQKRTDLPALAQKVLELQTADKFRLAGMLLDAGLPDQAEAVGTRACQEIQLSALFMKKAGR